MAAPGSIAIEAVRHAIGAATILEDVSLSISGGTFVTLLGPSGCGKTTLLRLIAGFAEPTQGAIRIDGRGMGGVPPRDRPIGMVFQNLALFPHLDVAENVAYGLKARGIARAEIARRVDTFLDLVGLGGFGQRRISQMSGGQKQRVALARSLVLEPAILLLDEPLSALDLQLRKQMQVELKKIQQAVRTTFVFVTHDQEEAAVLSDLVVVMERGRIRQTGTPREIYRDPRSHFVASFIGDLNALPARIAAVTPSGLDIEVAGQRATLPTTSWRGDLPVAAEACVMGFRPEDARLGAMPGLTLPAVSGSLAWTGATARIGLAVAGHPVTVLALAETLDGQAPNAGQGLPVSVPIDRLLLFPAH
jgi:ABC-type Fe3+/spermidine/putrescine transport system ATPase subunit